MRRRASRPAGKSSRAQFARERRTVLRREWRDWTILVTVVVALVVAIVLSSGVPQLLAAIFLGFAVTILWIGWVVGGDAHSLRWLWGAVGEEQTADVLEQLGDGWSCVHDIPRSRGNWDHIVVGPPGVFMLESKSYAAPSYVKADELRCGRLRTQGRATRGAAIALKEAIGRFDSQPPYVHAVVVIWGEFRQRRYEENSVAYLHGAELVDWLRGHPPKLSAERLATLRSAVEALAADAGAEPESGATALQPAG